MARPARTSPPTGRSSNGSSRDGKWAGLLDRFYQILPFGTGGRRGAVGVGPNRMNLWTLGRQRPGPLRVPQAAVPRRRRRSTSSSPTTCGSSRTSGRQYNPALPNPVLHLSSRDARPARRRASTPPTASTPTSCRRTARATSPRRSCRSPSATCRRHGGLNMSASHNPPDDNGGKFYDERGGQPVPPEDQIMTDLVDQVTAIQHAALGRRGARRQGPLPRRRRRTGPTSTCAASRAWSRRRRSTSSGRVHAAARRRRDDGDGGARRAGLPRRSRCPSR